MLALLLALAPAAQAAPRPYAIEPPPGWEERTDAPASSRVFLRLKGPQTSTFVLSEGPPLPMANRAAVRSYLVQVLDSLKGRTGVDFGPPGPLLTARYDNGLTMQYIKADLGGRPRLVLGAADFGGRVVLATLISAVPDTLMPSILGGLRATEGAAGAPGLVLSSDEQLQVGIPKGGRARALTAAELKAGFVLAIETPDTELMVLKVLEEDATAAKEQTQVVRQTVLAFPGVDAAAVSPVGLIETPPGPDFVYAWAPASGPSGPARFLAGYMPWGYWGYSVLAKGAEPEELARSLFDDLALGPSALPKVVAATPPISVPRPRRWRRWAAAAGVALALALALALRARGRR